MLHIKGTVLSPGSRTPFSLNDGKVIVFINRP